ncbi:MAG TPA: DUF4087 domain-containing protein [Allosphingosinicella sp.]|nr:DUF4087 domain-containing protein [Allosphingosinicella sp.]
MTGRLPAALAAILLASACSPGAAPSADANGQEAPSGTAASTAPEAAPAEPAAAASEPVAAVAPAAAGRRRCGWLSNPTPGNWWLTDAEGQWILATQGADQAPGTDDMPDMSTAGWVETNGHYGYGCACMTITADGDGRVTRIADAQPRPLKQCRADRKLPKPE